MNFKVKRQVRIACLGLALGWGFVSLHAQEVQESHPWTLQECIDYALENNINLQKSKISAASTAVDKLTAKAALFPSLSFSTSQNVAYRPFQEKTNYVSGGEVVQSDKKTSYNGNYGLNASWTIYNGSKRLKTIEQEKLNTRMAELDVAETANDIEEALVQTYIQILYAVEAVKVNENTLATSQAQFERGKQLMEAGSLSRVDVAQLEAQVGTDNYQLVTAQTTLDSYKLQLKQLLEIDNDQEMNIALPEINSEQVLVPLPEKSEIYQTALSLRPEIESGRINIQALASGIDIARSGYMPTVSMSAGIGSNNLNGSDFTFAEQMKNSWNNTVGITVSVPIFNNRQTKSAVQKAKYQYQNSILSLQEDQKNLYKTIESFWLDALSSQQRFIAAQERERSAMTSYELITEQFNLGMKNIIELLTEKNNLLSASQELLQAKYMALLNLQLLRFYQGEAFEL